MMVLVAVAVGLAATSQLLLIYGTFGRMYSLFAFASALAADLFVRALDQPTRRTAVAAAVSALTGKTKLDGCGECTDLAAAASTIAIAWWR